MLIRKMRLKHYGIDKEREPWIREQAKQEKNRKLLQFAAEQSNGDIADALVESLMYEQGYDSLSMKRYIPINRIDFYGYKRMTMYIFWLLLIGRELEQGTCQNMTLSRM